MSLVALIIGYGSIGQKHAKILASIKYISKVVVLTKQSKIPFEKISCLEEIHNLQPNYVVIASRTTEHLSQLYFFEKYFSNIKILIEKPLFNSYKEVNITNNKVYVGYNLRFHPVLIKIKKLIKDRKIWNYQTFCGSYLPEWRPDRNYKLTSSAKKKTGGGVLLDLSHEIDYTNWLIGPFEVKYSFNNKISDLEIDTDDILLLTGKSIVNCNVHISLNYFSRIPLRQVLIDGEGISIQADINRNKISFFSDGSLKHESFSNFQMSDTYLDEHEAILNDKISDLCTFEDGLGTLELIEKVRSLSR